MRSVRVYIHCAGCGRTLVVGEEVHSGEAIIVDALLEDHYCEEESDEQA